MWKDEALNNIEDWGHHHRVREEEVDRVKELEGVGDVTSRGQCFYDHVVFLLVSVRHDAVLKEDDIH